jgi:hypothetical protein
MTGRFVCLEYEFADGDWVSCIPRALWLSTLSGACFAGLALGRLVPRRRMPTWSLMHLMLATAFTSLFCLSFFVASQIITPLLVLAGFLSATVVIEFGVEQERSSGTHNRKRSKGSGLLDESDGRK